MNTWRQILSYEEPAPNISVDLSVWDSTDRWLDSTGDINENKVDTVLYYRLERNVIKEVRRVLGRVANFVTIVLDNEWDWNEDAVMFAVKFTGPKDLIKKLILARTDAWFSGCKNNQEAEELITNSMS